MLMVLSPSKTLDYETEITDISSTQPLFSKDVMELVGILRNYSGVKLSQLMDISDKLATVNYGRYQRFSSRFTRNNSRPCLFAFKGDVYEPMDISNYKKKELDYAQAHLRILSGLYGVLRPLDMMQPYRLEMGTRLKTARGKDLYAFWGDKITGQLNADAAKHKDHTLINLASGEYFGAVRPECYQGRIIHVVFKDKHKGGYKTIGLYAKKARGMMADYAIKNRITTLEALKRFNGGGYCYNADISSENSWIFLR